VAVQVNACYARKKPEANTSENQVYAPALPHTQRLRVEVEGSRMEWSRKRLNVGFSNFGSARGNGVTYPGGKMASFHTERGGSKGGAGAPFPRRPKLQSWLCSK
jgi:hypothetical protein